MMHLLYIDPGSGSFLVQAIVAAALGIVFYLKSFRNYIVSLFTRKRKKEEENKPQ
ncbi:MAG: hypothetical protein R2796_01770 [Chitinophagaceae bacterium]|nr:hypothetical protein [Chitinophagaceae bacterium]